MPYKLQDKEVYLLDLTALVAGTQFRGQFESRMKGLIKEITRAGNIILVIDEVHNMVGAGDAEEMCIRDRAQADRLIVMNDGSVIADGHPKTVFLSLIHICCTACSTCGPAF